MKRTNPAIQLKSATGAMLLRIAPVFILLGTWSYSCQHPFFWDTVQLASRQAQWYYDQNFHYLLLPDVIDSGHPSGFGMYLALCWKLFGQNLLVSHAAMLPWLGLLLAGLFRLGRIVEQPWGKFLPLLVVLDPVVLGQCSLVSPDVVLMALFIWGLVSIFDCRANEKSSTTSPRSKHLHFDIFYKRSTSPKSAELTSESSTETDITLPYTTSPKSAELTSERSNVCSMITAAVFRPRRGRTPLILSICTVGLALISLRGMMAVVVLYLYQVISTPDQAWRKPRHWLRIAWPYVPSGVFALAFLLYHTYEKTWIGFHEDSPWRESFNLVGAKGMLKNVAILSWRLLDYGRVFVVLGTLVLIFTQKKLLLTNRFLPLLVIALLMQLPHFLLLQGVSAHRYLLPVFLVLHALLLVLLNQSGLQFKIKSILLTVAILGMASGNFWIYPRGIAQGWDSTPAHWPHFALRKELVQYLDQQKIPLSEVGTVFPEIGPLHWRDLNGRQNGFSALDLQQNQYVYYSSVMNDFSDEQLELLFQKWPRILEVKKAGLETILFKKPQ